jgi:hypothetical protein
MRSSRGLGFSETITPQIALYEDRVGTYNFLVLKRGEAFL